jgi:glycosyltransferase involved in cell wall biosynthesis
MDPRPAPITPMVLLIGNYPLDRQQSMQRFTLMMLQGLTAAGVPAEVAAPAPIMGQLFGASNFIGKWLAYIDKFVFFPRELRKRLAERPAIVHICDHSNAMYAAGVSAMPTVVTCHDLIAVRSALGEELRCPVSFTGKMLQRWILRSLCHADALVCISNATRDDAKRLVKCDDAMPKIEVANLGLSYPYWKLSQSEAMTRLKNIPGFELPFVLHVGSNLPRKNREGVLRIFARNRDKWDARLVFAGEALDATQLSVAAQLGIGDRIIQVKDATDELLEALYNCAIALVYPSFSEGFGWPIIEAHACGCPVVSSNLAPLPEAAGDAGLFHDVDDEAGFAADLLRLDDSAERALWSEKSLRNAERFSTQKMISRYIDIYRSLGAQV